MHKRFKNHGLTCKAGDVNRGHCRSAGPVPGDFIPLPPGKGTFSVTGRKQSREWGTHRGTTASVLPPTLCTRLPSGPTEFPLAKVYGNRHDFLFSLSCKWLFLSLESVRP